MTGDPQVTDPGTATPADPPPETPPETPPATPADPPLTLDNWRDSLDEDLQTSPSLADIKDVPSLAKSYVHAQKLIGRDKVTIPPQDAPAEERLQVMDKLGRPDAPDKYSLSLADDVPEGVKSHMVQTGTEAWFRQVVHDAGLLPWQAENLWKAWGALQSEIHNQASSSQQEAMAGMEKAIKTEWGNAYDEKVKLAQATFAKFGDENSAQFLEQTGLGNHPAMLKMFAKIGEAIGEDTLIDGEPSVSVTPAEAKRQIAKIQGDREHPYHKAEHPQHGDAVKEMHRLYEAAYPETAGAQ